MLKSKKRQNQITELVILTILLTFCIFLWDTFFIYPIKIFVVFFHEMSHAFSAFLSGGNVNSINIGLDLSGQCEIEGGSTILIAISGYLGSLFFGILFFLSPNNTKIGKWIIISTSAIVFFFTVTVSTSFLFSLIAFTICSILIAASFFIRIQIISILTRALGLLSCIYLLFDIKHDIFQKNNTITDASILSNLLGISETVIGLIWLVLSFIVIIFALRITYKKCR